jgi:hypothetical protein
MTMTTTTMIIMLLLMMMMITMTKGTFFSIWLEKTKKCGN